MKYATDKSKSFSSDLMLNDGLRYIYGRCYRYRCESVGRWAHVAQMFRKTLSNAWGQIILTVRKLFGTEQVKRRTKTVLIDVLD